MSAGYQPKGTPPEALPPTPPRDGSATRQLPRYVCVFCDFDVPLPKGRTTCPNCTPRWTKAYVGGTFDLLHPGHVWLLERVKSQVDLVVVGLNTDEFNARYKGRKPIMSLEERMRMVGALRCVDGVMINEAGEDSKPGILAADEVGPIARVTHIVHGSDWQGPELFKQMGFDQDWLDQNGIQMLYIDLSPGYSTTSIRGRVIKRFEMGEKS